MTEPSPDEALLMSPHLAGADLQPIAASWTESLHEEFRLGFEALEFEHFFVRRVMFVCDAIGFEAQCRHYGCETVLEVGPR